jgi:hypothetical protein
MCCISCICCVQSIFRDEQIVGIEFHHQKRSVFCISDYQPVVLGPLPLRGLSITSPEVPVSFTLCSL